MKIDKENYEAFLLDYLEGCLSEEEEAVVEAFLRENPEAEAGFRLLQEAWGAQGEGLRVEAPSGLMFPGKESLLAIAEETRAEDTENPDSVHGVQVEMSVLRAKEDLRRAKEKEKGGRESGVGTSGRKTFKLIWKTAVSMAACLLLFWLCLPLLQREETGEPNLAGIPPMDGQEVLDASAWNVPAQERTVREALPEELDGEEATGGLEGTGNAVPTGRDAGRIAVEGPEQRDDRAERGSLASQEKEGNALEPEGNAGREGKQEAAKADSTGMVSPLEKGNGGPAEEGIPVQERIDAAPRLDSIPRLTPAEYRRLVTPMAPPKAYYAGNLAEKNVTEDSAEEEAFEKMEKKQRLQEAKFVERQQRRERTRIFFARMWESFTKPARETWEETKIMHQELKDWLKPHETDSLYQAFWEEESRF